MALACIHDMNDDIKVLLIEDNLEYRDVITLALKSASGIVLENQYGNAEIAIRNIDNRKISIPDVILLDLLLHGMNGIEAIQYFKEVAPTSKIIMLTQSDHEVDVLHAISQGASGYLLKSAQIAEIIGGIRLVHNGGASIDPDVAGFILNNLKSRMPEVTIEVTLSDRETEILTLLSDGLVKKEIADRLSIGYSTVDTHVKHIYEKLHVTNAPSAVSRAYRLGIFLPGLRKKKATSDGSARP